MNSKLNANIITSVHTGCLAILLGSSISLFVSAALKAFLTISTIFLATVTVLLIINICMEGTCGLGILQGYPVSIRYLLITDCLTLIYCLWLIGKFDSDGSLLITRELNPFTSLTAILMGIEIFSMICDGTQQRPKLKIRAVMVLVGSTVLLGYGVFYAVLTTERPYYVLLFCIGMMYIAEIVFIRELFQIQNRGKLSFLDFDLSLGDSRSSVWMSCIGSILYIVSLAVSIENVWWPFLKIFGAGFVLYGMLLFISQAGQSFKIAKKELLEGNRDSKGEI
ncbi:MAG: hypothetical protein HFE73_08105 [Firmicutes bacterium]|nr:hypothetical protein [Bacillota bacterium]